MEGMTIDAVRARAAEARQVTDDPEHFHLLVDKLMIDFVRLSAGCGNLMAKEIADLYDEDVPRWNA